MNVFAKFDEILSMIYQGIKERKRNGHTDSRTDGQRENSIPTHKHRVYNKNSSPTLSMAVM